MSDPAHPTFLVSAYSDPVVVKVNGKANYLNCNSFREFMETIISGACRRVFVDFEMCKGMDSTFLGILAGTGIELSKLNPSGELVIGNLSNRNYELICNLGLQNLLTVSKKNTDSCTTFDPLQDQEVSDTNSILKAHENLTIADERNISRFEDVITFLRNQVKKHDHK